MQHDYNTNPDLYIGFGQHIDLPEWATKETHPREREIYKTALLSTQYGVGADSLSLKIRQSPAHAQELLDEHRRIYRRYWEWQDNIAEYGTFNCELHTAYGWNLNVTSFTKDTTNRNFLIQGNGAEILRMACQLAIERGVTICGTNHDSLLIEAALDQIDHAVAVAKKAMEDASAIVLGGFRLRTDHKIYRYPDRYRDTKKKGYEMWRKIWTILAREKPQLKQLADQCLWLPPGESNGS